MRICRLHLTYVYAKFYMSDLEFKPISVQCMFVLTNANSAQNVSPKSKHPAFNKIRKCDITESSYISKLK